MSGLGGARQRHAELQHVWQPQCIKHSELEGFLEERPYVRLSDAIDSQLEELFRIKHPDLSPQSPDYYELLEHCKQDVIGSDPDAWGSWFYFPWNEMVVHVAPPAIHQQLRTARNRDLITETEQSAMADAVVAVAGMSVGSNVVAALAASGPWKEIRIADADEISLTNLNRIRTGLQDLALPKVTSVARKIYELDPYAQVKVVPEGITEDNLESFISGADVVVDEMDSLPMKARIRLAAKAAHIPVVMVTDNGDDNLLDIERFDEDPGLAPFHGVLSESVLQHLMEGDLQGPQFVQASMQIIGAEYAPVRLLRSVPEVGRTLAGVPQLGTSAMMGGALLAYVVRLIVTGEAVHTGKVPLEIEKAVLPHHPQLVEERRRILAALRGAPKHA